MEKKVKVGADLSNYIERLTYTAKSLRLLMVDAAERGLEKYPAFEHWEEKYTEANMELEIAKRQLEKRYIVPAVDWANYRWSLDFDTTEVTIFEVSV